MCNQQLETSTVLTAIMREEERQNGVRALEEKGGTTIARRRGVRDLLLETSRANRDCRSWRQLLLLLFLLLQLVIAMIIMDYTHYRLSCMIMW